MTNVSEKWVSLLLLSLPFFPFLSVWMCKQMKQSSKMNSHVECFISFSCLSSSWCAWVSLKGRDGYCISLCQTAGRIDFFLYDRTKILNNSNFQSHAIVCISIFRIDPFLPERISSSHFYVAMQCLVLSVWTSNHISKGCCVYFIMKCGRLFTFCLSIESRAWRQKEYDVNRYRWMG